MDEGAGPMRRPGRRRQLLHAAAAAALLAWSTAAPAAPAREPAEGIESLKQAALDLEVAASAAEGELLYPRNSSVSVYIGAAAADVSIMAVEISIDDRLAARRAYAPVESEALLRGGLDRALFENLAPGPHRLRAVFDMQQSQQPFRAIWDDSFVKQADAPAVFELSWQKAGLFTAPSVRLIPLGAQNAAAADSGTFAIPHRLPHSLPAQASYTFGGDDDPQVRAARFSMLSGRYLSAAAQLLRLRQDQAMLNPAPGYFLALSEALLGYGLYARAQDAYQAAVSSGNNAASLAKLQLRLADALYQQDNYGGARTLLADTPGGIEKQTLADWRDLQSRVALAQGRYGDAGDLLSGIENRADFASYVRYYNLGVALIQNGRSDQGATILERVGSVVSDDDLVRALCDRANLVLGVHFLGRQQGATAIPILERIRIDGPYSNQGLLDLGWAWLALPGKVQEQVRIGDEIEAGPPADTIAGWLGKSNDQNLYQRYHLHPFSLVNGGTDQRVRLKRALVPWSELAGHDADDAAVQEGLISVALALQRLGAHQEAAAYFKRAIEALQHSDASLDAATQRVGEGRWMADILRRDEAREPGGNWMLKDLPSPAVSFYLSDCFASAGFQSALHDYRDLRLLRSHLEDLNGRLLRLPDQAAAMRQPASTQDSGNADDTVLGLSRGAAALQVQIAFAEDAQAAKLIDMALSELAKRKDLTGQLLSRARLMLARDYDGVNESH